MSDLFRLSSFQQYFGSKRLLRWILEYEASNNAPTLPYQVIISNIPKLQLRMMECCFTSALFAYIKYLLCWSRCVFFMLGPNGANDRLVDWMRTDSEGLTGIEAYYIMQAIQLVRLWYNWAYAFAIYDKIKSFCWEIWPVFLNAFLVFARKVKVGSMTNHKWSIERYYSWIKILEYIADRGCQLFQRGRQQANTFYANITFNTPMPLKCCKLASTSLVE